MTLKIAQHLVSIGQAVACLGIRLDRLQDIDRLLQVSGSIGGFPQGRQYLAHRFVTACEVFSGFLVVRVALMQ